jgi:hypothetical protein
LLSTALAQALKVVSFKLLLLLRVAVFYPTTLNSSYLQLTT